MTDSPSGSYSRNIPQLPGEVNIITEADFPDRWRYLPLFWNGEAFVPSVAWMKSGNDQNKNLYDLTQQFGPFRGYDRDGGIYFGKPDDETRLAGHPSMEYGAVELAGRQGRAVGVMPEFSSPRLVVVDCDSKQLSREPVKQSDGSILWRDTFRTVYGIAQLMELFAKNDDTLPATVMARSSKPRHGHIYFRQNPDYRIETTKIRCKRLQLDVKVSGYVVHWSAPGRSLAINLGQNLAEVAEIPIWLARYFRGSSQVDRDVSADIMVQPGTAEIPDDDSWLGRMASAQLTRISDAVAAGEGRNFACYTVSCDLAEYGFSYESIRKSVFRYGAPWGNERVSYLEDVIKHAWRKKTGESL